MIEYDTGGKPPNETLLPGGRFKHFIYFHTSGWGRLFFSQFDEHAAYFSDGDRLVEKNTVTRLQN